MSEGLSFLNRMSYQLARPAHTSSVSVMRALLTPLRPHEFGNFNSKVIEVGRRTITILLNIAIFPVTMGCNLISGFADWVSSRKNPNGFIHLRGEVDAIQEGLRPYRIFTLNACMYYGGLPIPFGGMRPAKERIDELTDLIKRLRADIIVLEEVSLGPALRLCEGLKGDYAHMYTHIGPNPWRMESCLFVASKVAFISQPYFTPFKQEWGMKRGFFTFETSKCHIIATHMHAGSAFEARKMRKNQLGEIRAHVNKLHMQSNKPILVLGDLNISRKGTLDDEYTALGIREDFFNPFESQMPELTEETMTCTDFFTNYRLGRTTPSQGEGIVDHVLLDQRSQNKLEVGRAELVTTFSYGKPNEAISDHRGLLVEII